MALRLYNVRTHSKEPFAPADPSLVRMYVCGLTVYDHMHIGHARTAVSFEVIRRWLEHRFPAVRFVQNVTDVEDKIIARAVELGVSPLEHADKWDKECAAQADRLGVRPPDEAPHATTSMDGIIEYVAAIIERGFAYATDAGNVYFDVPGYDDHATQEFPEHAYGCLSRRDYREMAAGTRKDVESDKRHPADFALWKAAKEDDPTDAQWDSPWSSGRPGWHIECSHMSTHSLDADQIDIHGGGQDLIFPHHENEIAQTQAKTGKAPFVNVWMHSGFLNVEGTKMSKSLGNYITLRDALDELEAEGTDPSALRFYFVQTHYRSKIDFSRKGLDEAKGAVERLERTRRRLHEVAQSGAIGCADVDPELKEAADYTRIRFDDAMDDDIHTPTAAAALFDLARTCNAALDGPADKPVGADAARAALDVLETCGQVLTLFQTPVTADGPPQEVQALLEQRQAARAAKDWAAADALRDQIAAAGWRIDDTPNGPRLEPA